MNKTEALRILHAQLQQWRERSYADLCKDVGESRRFEVTGEGGTWYQGDVRVFWDDKADEAIRVIASIDDGGWRAFVPVTADFVLAPDGTFVGE
jgi:hypothetical protein